MIEAWRSASPRAVLEVEVEAEPRSQAIRATGGYTYDLRPAVPRPQCAVVVGGPVEPSSLLTMTLAASQ